MFNTKVTILPIFLALVLIYVILGSCVLLKLFITAIALFLIYINYISAKQAVCRKDNCFVSPIDGVVSSIEYEGDTATLTLITKLYHSAIVTMPKNDYVQVSHTDGVTLDLKSKLSQPLNQKITYSFSDATMTFTPQYFKADNYIESDRYYIGDVIGRLLCGEIKLQLQGYDIKVALGDKIGAKSTVIAYKNGS